MNLIFSIKKECATNRHKPTLKVNNIELNMDFVNFKPYRLKSKPYRLKFKPYRLKSKPYRLKFKPYRLKFKPYRLKFKPYRLKFKPYRLKFKPYRLKFKPYDLESKKCAFSEFCAYVELKRSFRHLYSILQWKELHYDS